MKKRKITLFASHFPPQGGGGITSAHANLFYAFKERGHEPSFISFQESCPDIKKQSFPPVFQFGSPLLFQKIIKSGLYVVFRIFEKFQTSYQTADILHSLWGALKAKKTLRSLDSEFWILPDQSTPLPFLNVPVQTKVIYFVHHHAPRFLKAPTGQIHSRLDTKCAVWIEKHLLKNKVHAVVCPSHAQKEVFLNTHPFVKNISVIPNLLNTKLLQTIQASSFKKKMGLKNNEPLIYIPGAGNKLKGTDYLFEILQKYSHFLKNDSSKIGFYCGGGISEKLLNQLKSIHPSFVLYGDKKYPYQEHLENVKACDFGMSPTLMESFGMALLEAVCLETPMIAFDKEATSEVLIHGKNGILVPFLDLNAFSKILAQWTLEPHTIPRDPNFLGELFLLQQEKTTLKLWDELFSAMSS